MQCNAMKKNWVTQSMYVQTIGRGSYAFYGRLVWNNLLSALPECFMCENYNDNLSKYG